MKFIIFCTNLHFFIFLPSSRLQLLACFQILILHSLIINNLPAIFHNIFPNSFCITYSSALPEQSGQVRFKLPQSLNPSIFEGLVTLCVPDFHLVCRFPYYSFNTYAKKLVLLYYSTLLYTRKNITVLTPENKKRTADTYTRTVLLLPKSTQH